LSLRIEIFENFSLSRTISLISSKQGFLSILAIKVAIKEQAECLGVDNIRSANQRLKKKAGKQKSHEQEFGNKSSINGRQVV